MSKALLIEKLESRIERLELELKQARKLNSEQVKRNMEIRYKLLAEITKSQNVSGLYHVYPDKIQTIIDAIDLDHDFWRSSEHKSLTAVMTMIEKKLKEPSKAEKRGKKPRLKSV